MIEDDGYETIVPDLSAVKVKRVYHDPQSIFLQPDCCVDWANEGRQWCEHDVWGGDCPEHSFATEYVRADLARQALKG